MIACISSHEEKKRSKIKNDGFSALFLKLKVIP